MELALSVITSFKIVEHEAEVEQLAFDENEVSALITLLQESFDNLNPDESQPHIVALEKYLPVQELAPISDSLEFFDFENAQEQTTKLAQNYNLHI